MAAPSDYPTMVTTLKQMLGDLIQTVENETASWAANGPKPTYNLSKNGATRQVSWTEWLSAMQQQIKDLNATIIAMDTPFEGTTRYYS